MTQFPSRPSSPRVRSARVYLPVSAAQLRLLAVTGELPGSHPVFTVSDARRRGDPQAEEEELEYDALCEAAEVDLGPRRIVLAADVDLPPGEPHAVDGIARAQVVAVHVSQAGADEEEELLWYDVSELDQLLAELDG